MKPFFESNGISIYQGDSRELLRNLPDESVHCCVTSPPYWGLRDYGVGGQIGLESTPYEYISTMRMLFAEVRRVLRADGVMFLNMGDSYAGYHGNSRVPDNDAPSNKPGYIENMRKSSVTSRARRAASYGTSDKAPVGSQGSDRLCENLCGECLAVYSRTTRSDSSRASMPTALPCAPSRDCTEYESVHLPTSDSCRQVDRTEVSSLGHSLAPEILDDALPVSLQSTKSQSSALPQGECLHCDNCGVCLSVLRSSSRDGSLCARKSDYSGGTSRMPSSSGDRRRTDHNGDPYIQPYSTTLKPKDLCGIPWMLAFALREDGWYLRQDIIWSKPNPMPESVTDRCTKSHEYIFLLSKSERYYFNQEAIKTPLKDSSIARLIQDVESQEGSDRVPGKTNGNMKAVKFGGNKQCPDSRLHSGKEWKPNMAGAGTSYKDGHSGYFSPDGEPLCGIMANKKSVWHVTTQPFAEAHFATFPEDLIKPCILAGCPEGGTVLDPFGGAGTTGLVARKLHCKAILLELNSEYIEISAKRLSQEVFNFEAVAGESGRNPVESISENEAGR